MEWFKKHADTVMILGAVAGSILWMNGKFNGIDRQFAKLETDIAVMKTVLIMQKIATPEIFSAQMKKGD